MARIYLPAAFFCLFLTLFLHPAFGEDVKADPKDQSDTALNELLGNIEKKYGRRAFSVDFDQESTLKAMQITDTATGKAFFQHPDKMRWEYETPDPQIIISNGEELFIYKPDENQVMTGKSPDFFRDGKGASFLTDIASIRKKFSVKIQQTLPKNIHELKLVPLKANLDIAYVLLFVSGESFEIQEIKTCNSYGDITRIIFKNIVFKDHLGNDRFAFSIPPEADIISMDE